MSDSSMLIKVFELSISLKSLSKVKIKVQAKLCLVVKFQGLPFKKDSKASLDTLDCRNSSAICRL